MSQFRSAVRSLLALASAYLVVMSPVLAQVDSRLVGIWTLDEGFQVTEFLFRSDGRYQIDKRSTDPVFDFSSSDGGRYQVQGQALTLRPYDFFGERLEQRYEFQLDGDQLTFRDPEFDLTYVYTFKPGSREDVLARQNVTQDLIGAWTRSITFFGKAEYTFRPGGYYFLKNTAEDSQFPPEYIRGRYEQNGARLTLTPYSGVAAEYELDFFGNTLTLIESSELSGRATPFSAVQGSGAEVRAKAAEAEAFLNQENWQAGVWEIRDDVHTVDLTLRPDGHYTSTNAVELLRGMVRGRYTLEPGKIQFSPFDGQGIYSRDNGDFGKVARARAIDYYDGELQLIDLEAISQSVAIARKRAGSQAVVIEKAQQARAERARAGWQVGVWVVNDPTGWMEFTFRPDNRYIAQSGAGGVASQVERGQYVVRGDKLTLAPYPGLGEARAFEVDLYDGELILAGDLSRMVVARKNAGSEPEVIEMTQNPASLKGERGAVLGLWTAKLPGHSEELVFRPDGEFRLKRCANNAVSEDYGLFSVDMAARALVYDSRFAMVQTLGMDFYGDTLTLFGGVNAPRTYTVNLGVVDAAIVASLAADAAEAQIDAQWLARVPIGPHDPNAIQIPTGDIPADPNPARIFPGPTVFTGYHLYRRLTSALVFFNENGIIKSVPVVNTSELHFFPTGRVLVRFKNYHASWPFPNVVADVTSSWGAYRIEPKPAEADVLHRYADNALFIESDNGEPAEMTLEDGRRHLFWGKDYQILSEWAAEQKPIPCQPAEDGDASLMNTGLSLSSPLAPDDAGDASALRITISGPAAGQFTISGTAAGAGTLVLERTAALGYPAAWETVETATVSAGPFSIKVAQGTNANAFFRVRVD